MHVSLGNDFYTWYERIFTILRLYSIFMFFVQMKYQKHIYVLRQFVGQNYDFLPDTINMLTLLSLFHVKTLCKVV